MKREKKMQKGMEAPMTAFVLSFVEIDRQLFTHQRVVFGSIIHTVKGEEK